MWSSLAALEPRGNYGLSLRGFSALRDQCSSSYLGIDVDDDDECWKKFWIKNTTGIKRNGTTASRQAKTSIRIKWQSIIATK